MAAAQNSFDADDFQSSLPTLKINYGDDYFTIKDGDDIIKEFTRGECVSYYYRNLHGIIVQKQGRIDHVTGNSIGLDDLNSEGYLSIREMPREPTRLQMVLRTIEKIPCPPPPPIVNGGKKSKRRKRRKRKSKKH